MNNIHIKLWEAVSAFDLNNVNSLLEQDADPNFEHPEYINDNHLELQPNTTLKLVVFRISDCNLTENDLSIFLAITKNLLKKGATPEPALKLATLRYGPIPIQNKPYNTFIEILKCIEKAAMK